ncbi:MAG: hypothetical protein ACJ8E5_01670, partial [Xanthobacteraceae bacterium]
PEVEPRQAGRLRRGEQEGRGAWTYWTAKSSEPRHVSVPTFLIDIGDSADEGSLRTYTHETAIGFVNATDDYKISNVPVERFL